MKKRIIKFDFSAGVVVGFSLPEFQYTRVPILQ